MIQCQWNWRVLLPVLGVLMSIGGPLIRLLDSANEWQFLTYRAAALVAVLGPGLGNVVIALSVLGWTGFARLVRGQVLSIKTLDYVLAARSLGAGHLRLMTVHILPNLLAPVLVQASFAIAGAILAEASLSFLGLGVPPGTPSWGAMLAEGRQFILLAPHLTVWPGIAILLTVLGINLLGDGLRDALHENGAKRQPKKAAGESFPPSPEIAENQRPCA